MPIFAALMGAWFNSLAVFFAFFLARKVAIVAAAILFLVALTAGFVAAMQALITGVIVAAPDWLAIGASWFVPSNVDECIAAIAGAHTLRWTYDWQVKVVGARLM